MSGLGAVRRPACPAHPALKAATTCGGCGAFLCADCAGSESRCGRCRGEQHPVPWEDPRRPRLQAYAATLKRLFDPAAFFGLLPSTGGLRRPLEFAVLSSCLGTLGSASFGLLSALGVHATLEPLLRGLAQSAPPQEAELLRLMVIPLVDALLQSALRIQLATLLLAPLSALVSVLVIGALTHALARWLGGQGSFEATVRAVAYSQAARLLEAVPGPGGLLALVAGLVLATAGLRRAHGVSGGRAFLLAAWWIPVAVLFGVVLAGLFLGVLLLRLAPA